MRILRFNETQTYNITKELIEYIRDISMDLKDENIRYIIQPNNHTKIEKLSEYLFSDDFDGYNNPYKKFIYQKFFVAIIVENLTDDKKNQILETFKRLENFAMSENLVTYYEFLPKQNHKVHMTNSTVSRKGTSPYKNSFITTKNVDESIFEESPLIIKIIFDKR